MEYSEEDIQNIIAEKLAEGKRTGLISLDELPKEVMWAVLRAISDQNLKQDAIRRQERAKQGLPPETHTERLIRSAEAATEAINRLESNEIDIIEQEY